MHQRRGYWRTSDLQGKFNPNHDARGRFDFGSGDTPNGDQTTPAYSAAWPQQGNSGFDVNAALQELQTAIQNAGNTNSTGNCAAFVRHALQAGGINLTDHPYAAKDYGPYLDHAGAVKLSPLPSPNFRAQPRDIVVFQPLNDKANGHIQIFDGRNYLSDYRQPNGFWPSHAYMKAGKGYAVFRP